MPHYRAALIALAASISLLLAPQLTHQGTAWAAQDSIDQRVQVSYKKENGIEYVQGKIRIPNTAAEVFPILANPFEFEQTISPRFKTLEVVVDRPDLSILRCQVDVGFLLPPIKYTVASRYSGYRIDFQSIAGDLRDFRGYWLVEPVENETACDVTYSMYVQPGIPIPQWLVRQGIRIELPKTLAGLRSHVQRISSGKSARATRRLCAAAQAPTARI